MIAVNRKDGRQKAAAAWLQANGCCVVSPSEKVPADVLVVQMPFCPSMEELEFLLRTVKPGGMILAGMPSDSAIDRITGQGYRLEDYAQREEFVMLNAVPTAEACLKIIMASRKKTIWNSNVLITGFGRIGKLLARHCVELGAKVTVAARNAGQRAEAQAWGCKTIAITQLCYAVKTSDIIINTVPSLLFGQEVLQNIDKQCFMIDLASTPGGFDFETAEKMGLQLEWARGLPPIHTPDTAGEILGQTIHQILLESGEII